MIHELYLKGFAGIKAGLGLDELRLNFDTLPEDAQLIALTGPNGNGKTTILDNLHPYRLMPSRAGSYSPNAFSFYDHLCASEAEKVLVWSHEGVRYKTHLLFRVSGTKRKTDAFLFVLLGTGWQAASLADGTVSDGKTDTYDRCVEGVLGASETFFTSAFSAQNRKPLSSYGNGEIKSLMMDLLGQEVLREKATVAAEVRRLMEPELRRVQDDLTALDARKDDLEQKRSEYVASQTRARELDQTRAAAQANLTRLRSSLAALELAQQTRGESDARRASLTTHLTAEEARVRAGVQAGEAALVRERTRLQQLNAEHGQHAYAVTTRIQQLDDAAKELGTLLGRSNEIKSAAARLPETEGAERHARQALCEAQDKLARKRELDAQATALRQSIVRIEREVGSAVLSAQDLEKRVGLTAAVPCNGMALQEGCHLLHDARAAKNCLPSTQAALVRLKEERAHLAQQISANQAELAQLGDAAAQVAQSRHDHDALRLQLDAVRSTAALVSSLESAEIALSLNRQERELIAKSQQQRLADHQTKCAEIADTIEQLETRLSAVRQEGEAALRQLRAQLNQLPPPFDEAGLQATRAAVDLGSLEVTRRDNAYLDAVRKLEGLRIAVEALEKDVASATALRNQVDKLGDELGWWVLLEKAFSQDGIIALCIDDAGPILSRFTNDLLLSCYGGRFTVSIRTQVETAKKTLKEGFDIVVFDSETGETKSVSVMSPGEKVWINECMTRAIGLYLATSSDRSYDTLFTDETDGSLDLGHKRMFMQMKREVLRIGGHRREFFISHTPELCEAADAVIHVPDLAVRGASG